MLQFFQALNDYKNLGEWEKAENLIQQHYSDDRLLSDLHQSYILIAQNQYEFAAEKLKQLSSNGKFAYQDRFGIEVAKMHLYWNTKEINQMVDPQQQGSELLSQFTDKDIEAYSYWVAMYYNLTSRLYNREGNLKESEIYLNKGIKYFEIAKAPFGIIKSMINLSVVEKDRGNYSQVLDILEDALEKLQQLDSRYLSYRQLEYMIKGNMASTYLKLKQFDKAYIIYNEIERLVQEFGSEADYCIHLVNLGSTSMALENYEVTPTYLNNALEIALDLDNHFLLSYIYRNIGEMHYHLRDFTSALLEFNRSLDIATELDLKIVIASNLSFIGLINAFQGHLSTALNRYLEVMELIDEDKGIFDPDFLDSAYHTIATVYARQGKLQAAEEYWKKQLEVCQKMDDSGRIMVALFSLFHLYLDTEQKTRGINYYHQLQSLPKDNRGMKALSKLATSLKLKYISNDRMESINILSGLVNKWANEPMRVFGLNHHITSVYNLCELYIREYADTGNKEYLRQAQEQANNLTSLAQKQNLILLEGETHILRSKFKVLQLHMSEANNLLTTALEIATNHQLPVLEDDVRSEMASIVTGERFDQMDDMDELMKQTNILMFLRTKGGSRGSFPDF